MLEFFFSYQRITFMFIRFVIHESPGNSVFGGMIQDGIVRFQSPIHILAGANIEAFF